MDNVEELFFSLSDIGISGSEHFREQLMFNTRNKVKLKHIFARFAITMMTSQERITSN